MLFGRIKIYNSCLNVNKVKKAWEISNSVSHLIFSPWKLSWLLGRILHFRDDYCVTFITVILSNCINEKQNVEWHQSICIPALINTILKSSNSENTQIIILLYIHCSPFNLIWEPKLLQRWYYRREEQNNQR